jgi:hypothetical protein
MKVGETIYVRLENNAWYRELEIMGETSRSWECLPTGQPDYIRDNYRTSDWVKRYIIKLPKNGKGYTCGTKIDADLQRWAADNHYAISQRVDRLWSSDPNTLRTIAGLVGFEKMEVGQ